MSSPPNVIHADDTTVPVLAKLDEDKSSAACGPTSAMIGRSAAQTPPAALFYYSRGRAGEHPRAPSRRLCAGIMQADAFRRVQPALRGRRKPLPSSKRRAGPTGRTKILRLGETGQRRRSPGEAVRRIDVLFEIERGINGRNAGASALAVRHEQSTAARCRRPASLAAPRSERSRSPPRTRPPRRSTTLLKRWTAFTRFLDDGRICLTNNAAERALRGVAVGRGNWTFAGSDAGGHRPPASLHADRNLQVE